MDSRVSSSGAHPKPAGGPELYWWLFMRGSGLLLLFLALGHLFIMHVFNSIHEIDYNFVAARYRFIFWRAYDLSMLWLAVIHGLSGLRILVDDYLRPPWRGWVVKGIVLSGLFFLLLGSWVIIAFRPVGG